jgi:hypothetical protein
MRRRRSWPETYAKDVLGTILEVRGQVIMEHEIVERRLRADMLFVPEEMFEDFREDHMMSPESQARYNAWESKIRGEGIKQGRKQGMQAGIEKGERALVRKQLTLRFGRLPADAEQRLRRASLADLERWAERVLSAENLAAVFAD